MHSRDALFLTLIACACAAIGCRSSSLATQRLFIQANPTGVLAIDSLINHGVKLGPGDVLYVRRWSPGAHLPDRNPTLNRRGPTTTIDRIPLRIVGEPGRLYDYEREFLANILTANRSERFNDEDEEWKNARRLLADSLHKHERDMWNFLSSGGLSLKRDTTVSGSFGPLRLNVDMQGLLRPLDSVHASLKKLFNDSLYDFSGIGQHYARPYEALVGSAHSKNKYYYSGENDNPNYQFAVYNFITAGLSAVDVDIPEWPEIQWTLREWEQSGIWSPRTPGAEAPRFLWIQFSPGGRKYFIDRNKDIEATHEVRWTIIRTNDPSGNVDEPAISLTPDDSLGRVSPLARLIRPFHVRAIDADDLDRLTLHHISRLAIGTPRNEHE